MDFEDNQALAEPFSQIFSDPAEADWAFDFLLQATKQLGITNPYDERFALTLTHRAGKPGLHLNFGGWLVLGFRASRQVEMTLLTERIIWDERFTALPFDRKDGDPEIRSYLLPLSMVKPLTSDLQAAFEATLEVIAAKFHTWKRAIPWKQHQPEIVEALFDLNKRQQLFANGLKDLLYERHLTAFYQDVSEEVEGYAVEMTPENKMIEIKSEHPPQKDTVMDLTLLTTIEDELKEALDKFRQNPYHRFSIKLRRKRAGQIRALLANPDLIEVETFNSEVWAGQSSVYLRGQRITIDNKSLSTEEQIVDIEEALETGELDFHGNAIWGSGSRVYAPMLKDDAQKKKYIHQALSILNNPDVAPPQKVQQLTNIYGFGNNIATGLVMIFHPTEYGIYNSRGEKILQKLGFETKGSLDTYQEILHSLKAALNIEDFLELDWFLMVQDEYERDDRLHSERNNILEDIEVLPDDPEAVVSLAPSHPLPQLAETTGFDETELARWVRAIERKGQAVLYGPPGTGKTYVAEQLARHLIGGGDGFWKLVQFHPAYAYEDFMQGIRPQSEGGYLSYPIVPGRFLEFCRQADTYTGRCVLIIDEINRANLARVFGELMYLLEYRDREIPLAGGGLFKIPENVRLIGTMNTADRSIALVDHALRRRFAFIKLYPNFEVLRRYHEQTNFAPEGLIKVLQRLNQVIQDQDYAAGITFFLREDLTEHLEDIWRMEIEPYLEEYFFGQPDQADNFRWEKIEPEVLPR